MILLYYYINIMNIFSVFAGRKANIEILKKYLKKALELNIINEVHFWNNTRNSDDEDYLKTISNLKRTSSSGSGIYTLITPLIINNSFELNVKASNDIHIKITNLETEYEIVLGGWNNTMSVIRQNDKEIFHLIQDNVADDKNTNNFKVVINNNQLNILKNDELLIYLKIQDNFEIKNVYFKTGHLSIGHLTYDTTQDKGFYFMDTCEKNWNNYYNYYDNPIFKNDVIIKCDDDIVFIDLYKLPKFIDFIKNNDYDLVFANIINNGVSAYYQQNKYNLIPKEIMNLEYPPGGLCGTLWESGIKAETLHNYFINNYEKFLDYDYNNETIPINTRFSINLFGYKGKNWYKINPPNNDHGNDEYNLTVQFVKTQKFKNILYSDFYVSHLSFHKQNATGINLNKLLSSYNDLYSSIEQNGRFTRNV
jgi:hypothetical protein